MRALHVVTAISNPLLLRSRITLHQAFAEHMIASGVHLTTVECAYGGRDFETASHPGRHIGVRAPGEAIVWNKENLLNIGIASLPDNADRIGTFDADIRFRNPSWVSDCLNALDIRHVIQPWADCYDLGPNDENIGTHRSLGRLVAEGHPFDTKDQPETRRGPYDRHHHHPPHPRPRPIRIEGHPGYAWAWRRSVLEATNGLLETAAMGAGDRHMAYSLIGHASDSFEPSLTDDYKLHITRWQNKAVQAANYNIGHSRGSIEHYFHGSKDDRSYHSRWQTLVRHRFSPSFDLAKNLQGVIMLSGNKPELRDDILRYLASRKEDANCL